MWRLLLLFAALLASLTEAFAPAKRQTTEHVTDGSFESVSPNAFQVADATSGDWALSGGSTFFTSNSIETLPYKTPYGK